MELSKSKQEELLEKLDKLWVNKVCSLCKSENWQISEFIFRLEKYDNQGVETDARIPLIPVTCNICGNTHLIHTAPLNIDITPKDVY